MRIRNLTLDGLSFPHEYRNQQAARRSVLETILAGGGSPQPGQRPGIMILPSTIAILETVKKALHKVLRDNGVFEGSDSDFGSGPAVQTPKDVRMFIYNPLRLTAVAEAPRSAIDTPIEKHQDLTLLVDHGRIQMHAIDDQGCPWRRPRGGGDWSRGETDTRRKPSEAA